MKLVVLISGNGSNLQAILDACANKQLNSDVVAVIANKENAFGLERARKFNIPALVYSAHPDQTRQEYDRGLAQLVSKYQPDWIVLAGWMRLLSKDFLDRFPHQVINLHPALPGMFPGTQAIARAYEAYQRHEISHTGVMVHLVPDEGVDSGPVIVQENVEIFAEDTLAILTTRVRATEHRLLITALQELQRRKN